MTRTKSGQPSEPVAHHPRVGQPHDAAAEGPIAQAEAVARLGSVSDAATELFVTPGAISQQIRKLESCLGVRLVERNGRGVGRARCRIGRWRGLSRPASIVSSRACVRASTQASRRSHPALSQR